MGKPGRAAHNRDSSAAKGLAARAFAVKALGDILKSGIQLDDALAALRASDLPGNDKSFAHAIVATSLRRHGQISDVLQRFLAKPLPAKSGCANANLIAAGAQMLFMDIPPHAAIDLAVRVARQDRAGRHFAGLTNAVLRKVADAGKAIVAAQDEVALNFQPWMLESWTAGYGPAAAAQIGSALLAEAPLDISVKGDAARWAEVLDGELLDNGSVRLSHGHGPVAGLPGFAEGQWWVQDAASSLPVKLLGDVTGKRVLDLCAAPGGKTAQLAAAGADVTAVDNSAERMERLKDNLARLELAATTVVADAAGFASKDPFDAVIADVPCSATGTLRRHPDGIHSKSRDLVAALRPLQEAILENAIAVAKPGGHIIYSTCSLQVEEGEELIRAALGRHGDIARHGLGQGDAFGHGELITADGDLRALPQHGIGQTPGMDGFYACRLIKA